MTTKNTTKKPAKKAAKKAPKRKGPQGSLKPGSRSTITYNARIAFDTQDKHGNVPTGMSFDEWRHDEVMKAVKRPGVSACDGKHYRPLMVHFLTLADREDEALKYGFKTGPVKDHGDPNDTHEAREMWAALIYNDVAAHIALADTAAADVAHYDLPLWLAIQDGGGALREGYVMWLAKQKFGFTKGYNRLVEMKADDKLSGAAKLEMLHHTMVNRIAAREGRGETENRNKKQSSPAAQAARKAAADPGEMAPRFDAE